MGIDKKFWKDKKVFITGHTGFKGPWLCIWLSSMGANITGYALKPEKTPNLFELTGTEKLITSIIGDIRDKSLLEEALLRIKPHIVIHMAAQALVRKSYENPSETYDTNIMGTVNLFEAIRVCKSVRAVINVTTDKCYENKEWYWPYRETDPLGGYDPYSASKACSEIITASYRRAFFNPEKHNFHGTGVASARSGNVIGGGDWSKDRLFPDCFKALMKNEKIIIRNPGATRPWQHVLEPLGGYIMLGEKLYISGKDYSEAWNFGPEDSDSKTVEWLVKKLCEKWDSKACYEIDKSIQPHEAFSLKLDSSRAKAGLGWTPKWNIEKAIGKTIEWMKAYEEKKDMKEVCLKQIEDYITG